MSELTRDDLLVLLIEECAEVIQAATKCLRFGFDVDHGVDYGNNRTVLSREVGDVLAIIDALPLDEVNVNVTRVRKIAKATEAKARYGRAVGASSPCGDKTPRVPGASSQSSDSAGNRTGGGE